MKNTDANFKYRIKVYQTGFEPQMLSNCGAIEGQKWFPLLATGFWADPGAYSYGIIRFRSILPTRVDAECAIERAKLINAGKTILGLAQ
jgi:hypothetical protein